MNSSRRSLTFVPTESVSRFPHITELPRQTQLSTFGLESSAVGNKNFRLRKRLSCEVSSKLSYKEAHREGHMSPAAKQSWHVPFKLCTKFDVRFTSHTTEAQRRTPSALHAG